MLTLRYLTKNKKRTLITISSIILVTYLFLSIGLLFSSIRDYMIDDILKTDNYHVKLKTNNLSKKHLKKVYKINDIYYITYDNIKNTYKYTKDICKKNKCQDISYNTKLLSLYGISKNTNMVKMLTNFLIIILAVLSLGIMIIIYNSFSISVMERKRQFSLLKSIGMTQRKIRYMVLWESVIILILGLIIGFFISVNLVFIFLHIISNLLSDLFTHKLSLAFYPLFIIIPIIFTVLIVLISAYIPAYKAGKVNIIKGVNNKDDYKYKKTPKFIEKLSITKKLAYFNYKRCQKKYRPVVLCIFICVIIYMAFSMYLNYGIKGINDFNSLPSYDSEVTILNSDSNKKNLLEKFAKEKGEKYNLFNMCILKTKIDSNNYLNKNYNNTNLIVTENKAEYVINHIKQVETKNNKMTKINTKFLKNKIMLNGREIKTKDKIPFGFDNYLTKDNIVLVTNKFNDYCQNYNTTLFMNSNIDLKKEITNNITNIEYVDVKKANKIMNNIITVIKIVLYTVTLLVVLICISCVINTIWASTNLRSRELASLKSVGLTQRQMHSMLLYESIYITSKGFIIALPFVFLINYLLYKSIIKVFNMENIFPYKELIISFIFLLIIIYLTMLITHRKFNTKKVIEIITNDNI